MWLCHLDRIEQCSHPSFRCELTFESGAISGRFMNRLGVVAVSVAHMDFLQPVSQAT